MMPFSTHILDKSLADRRKKLEKERQLLLTSVCRALNAMRERHTIKEAYILGSLVHSKWWCSSSDVDVAVSGCSSSVLDIMKELEDVTRRPVDVIDLDYHLQPERVKNRGQKVYG